MKQDKGKLLGKLTAAKSDIEKESQIKYWHMTAIFEALIYS